MSYLLSSSKEADVFVRLREDIVLTRLPPSSKLKLKEIADRYGTGMSPLREALFQLVSIRLVVLVSQRGFHVAPISLADLKDVIATRMHLELYAFNLSLLRGDDAWRKRVRVAADRLAIEHPKAGDPRGLGEHWQKLHRDFHFSLLSACGSPSILAFSEEIYDRFDRYRRIALNKRSFMAAVAFDHEELAKSLMKGEDAKALLILEQHIKDIASIVIEQYETTYPEQEP